MDIFLQVTIRNVFRITLITVMFGALVFLLVYLGAYHKTRKKQKINKLYNKAIRYLKKGDFDTALEYLKKALASIAEIKDKKHIEAANAMIKIALVYKIKEKYHEALTWYKKAYSIKLHAYSAEHKDVISIKSDIAEIKKAMRKKT